MTNAQPITVSFKPTGNGVYRITYDNVVLGDSRGYDKEGARAEALRLVNNYRVDGQIATHIYQPGY